MKHIGISVPKLVLFALGSAAAFAQTPAPVPASLKGSYLFTEQGTAGNAAFAALGVLDLDASGAVTGSAFLQSAGRLISAKVTGSYTSSASGAGKLSLAIAERDAGDDAVPALENIQFFSSPREIAGLRSDAGVNSSIKLIPVTAAANLKGSYVLAEQGMLSSGQNYLLLSLITFGSNGAVTGKSMLDIVGQPSDYAVTGTQTLGADGVGSLALTLSDSDGNVILMPSYKFAAVNDKEMKAIRVDAGAVGTASLEAR